MNKDQLTALFQEINSHLLADDMPSEYMNTLSKMGALKQYPFSLLEQLQLTEQSPKYHPEGNVWNHTMLVLDEAAKVRNRSNNPEVFMWSALLHDIGKPSTTKRRKGRIISYDHDIEGERLSLAFLQCFSSDDSFLQSVAAMVRYHMHMLYILKELPYADIKGLGKRVEIQELALLCLCDRLGRTGADYSAEVKNYKEFIEVFQKEVSIR